MKEKYKAIYDERARDYDRLVRREDAAGRLRAWVRAGTMDARHIAELGAGTGRLTQWLVERGAEVLAFDRSPAMLAIARDRVPQASFTVADSREVPLADGWADLAIEGWSFGHLVDDGVRQAVDELLRVLRPGGYAVIIETLGTGVTEPSPPNAGLAAFYEALERDGFERTVLRTDYRFESPEEAATLLGFFFGDAFAAKFAAKVEVPECTGVWVKRK